MIDTANSKYSYNTEKSGYTELSKGIYEFEVSGRYIYGEMRTPKFIFLIDTSIDSLSNGLFNSVIGSI